MEISLPIEADALFETVQRKGSGCQLIQDAWNEKRQNLRTEILASIWTDVVAILCEYGCKSVDECNEAIVTVESFLHLVIETNDANMTDFKNGFAHLVRTARLSKSLKLGITAYMANSVPKRNLLRFVLTVSREAFEPDRALEIVWESSPEYQPLSMGIPRPQFEQNERIKSMRAKRMVLIKDAEAELLEKQKSLRDSISAELERIHTDLKSDVIQLRNLAPIAKQMITAKLISFKDELDAHVEKIKRVCDVDVEIFRESKRVV